jgi:hypothetical protein
MTGRATCLRPGCELRVSPVPGVCSAHLAELPARTRDELLEAWDAVTGVKPLHDAGSRPPVRQFKIDQRTLAEAQAAALDAWRHG